MSRFPLDFGFRDRNPVGLYANYNAAVPLCTQLLGGEPIQ